MAKYVLPGLGYDYGALEPHISGQIMQLHHDKHHRGYVDGANHAIEQLQEARQRDDFQAIGALERAIAFNVSGHVLHSVFWQNMRPGGGGTPEGELAEAIDRDFGSFASFKKQMIQAAATIMGSGWSALVWDPVIRRLGTIQIHDHQSEVTQAGVPLLVMDAWEHAYYLQYHTDKLIYLQALWNVWNWEDVGARFLRAQELELNLVNAALTPVDAQLEEHAPH